MTNQKTAALAMLILLAFAGMASAQRRPERPPSSIDSTGVLPNPGRKTAPADTTPAPDPVREPAFRATDGVQFTDSLFRWQYARDFYEFLQRQPGRSMVFRTYGTGRSAGVWEYGMAPVRYAMDWEGAPAANPLTGSAPLEQLPLPILQQIEETGPSQVSFGLRRYLLAKPLSDARFERAGTGYRLVSALHSQNFSKRLNATGYLHAGDEQGVYDRQRAGEFHGAAQVTWQPAAGWRVDAGYLTARVRLDQPDGYLMDDPAGFSFNRFTAQPKDAAGRSVAESRWFKLAATRVRGTAFWNAGIYRNRFDRRFQGETDTARADATEAGVFVRSGENGERWQWQQRASAGLLTTGFSGAGRLLQGGWNGRLNGRIGAAGLQGSGGLSYRSDGYAGGFLHLHPSMRLSGLTVGPFFQAEQGLPSLQERFHTSLTFQGNPDLKAFTKWTGGMRLRFQGQASEAGIEGGISRFKRAVFPGADSVLFNGPDFQSWFVSAGGSATRASWTGSVQANAAGRRGSSAAGYHPLVTARDAALWIQSEAAYRGPVFQKAAFLYGGVRTLFSPLAYRTSSYVPVLDQWMLPLEAQEMPGFFRMDLFLSARIRSMFIYYQVENVLNGIGQAGYFETARYPMPGRRFRFGLRWVVRN